MKYVLVPAKDKRVKGFKEVQKLGITLLNRLTFNHDDVHPNLLTFDDEDILSSFTQDDTLYITAHGCISTIGTSGDDLSFTPEQLADELHKAHLSSDLETIKIMACYSAITKDNMGLIFNERSRPAHPDYYKYDKSYAERFKDAMEEYDYTKLDTVGYLGETAESVGKRGTEQHSLVIVKNKQIRASQAKLWFLGKNSSKDYDDIQDGNEFTLSMLSM